MTKTSGKEIIVLPNIVLLFPFKPKFRIFKSMLGLKFVNVVELTIFSFPNEEKSKELPTKYWSMGSNKM